MIFIKEFKIPLPIIFKAASNRDPLLLSLSATKNEIVEKFINISL